MNKNYEVKYTDPQGGGKGKSNTSKYPSWSNSSGRNCQDNTLVYSYKRTGNQRNKDNARGKEEKEGGENITYEEKQDTPDQIASDQATLA